MAREINMNTCRLCGNTEYVRPLIKYGVRHYAHADCALQKWGAAFFDRLKDWQLGQFPALTANKYGLLPALVEKSRSIEGCDDE